MHSSHPHRRHCIHNIIPEDMKGAPVNNAAECYAARGLGKPRIELAGTMVVGAGDASKTTSIITPAGVARRVGGGNDWRAYNECQLNDHQYRVHTMSLHEIYQIEHGPAVTSGAECKAALGPHWKEFRHARAGQFIVYGDEYKNVSLVLPNGTKRWIGNKDNWSVFNACGLQERNLTYVSSAEDRAIPGTAPIGNGDECRQLVLDLNPPSERDRLRAEMNKAVADRILAEAREQAAAMQRAFEESRNRRRNNCQAWADTYFIASGKGFGAAPPEVQNSWRTTNCDEFGTTQSGTLQYRCQRFRNTYGIVDGRTWGSAGREAQGTYRNIGCRAGV